MKKITTIALALCTGFFLFTGREASAQTATFNYTGASQSWTVPCGVNSVTLQVYGAQGQNSACVGSGGGTGSNGGYITGTMNVSPGDVLYFYVGGQSGWNGGGLANTAGIGAGCAGGNGGDASDVRYNGTDTANIVLIAGGGGGAGGGNTSYTGGNGGVGGGATADSGTGSSGCGGCNFGGGGGGGSQVTAGGAGCGGCSCIFNGSAGSKFQGGNGCTQDWRTGGGGGGGYYGGGGGGSYCATGGGGGGSSWAAPSISAVTSTQGVQTGLGSITINWVASDTVSAVTGNIINNVKCNGNSNGSASAIVTGGLPPYTYVWTPAVSTSDTATGLSAGTYTVAVNTACGTPVQAVITITQPNVLNLSVNPTANELCHGEAIGSASSSVSGGTKPYSYAWSVGGNTTDTAVGLSAGTYTLTVNDSNGCSMSAAASITQPTAISLVSGFKPTTSMTNCNGAAWVTVSGGTTPYKYLWSPGGATTDSIKSLCNGSYCCTVTDSNGCVDSVCVSVVTGIADLNHSNSINIYPDPTDGHFTITGLTKGLVVELYNYMGQQISSTLADNSSMKFNIADKASGTYFVRILAKDGSVVKQDKLMKSN